MITLISGSDVQSELKYLYKTQDEFNDSRKHILDHKLLLNHHQNFLTFLYDYQTKIGNEEYVYIEFPEFNLHPKYQLQIVEMLICISKKTNANIFIRTYSDNIMNAFRIFWMKGVISSSDFNIVFLTENEKIKIKIYKDGSLSEYPNEFFVNQIDKDLNILL